MNALRKKSGLTIEDQISLVVQGPDEVLKAIEEHKDTLLHSTLAQDVRTNGELPETQDQFTANEFEISVGFATL